MSFLCRLLINWAQAFFSCIINTPSYRFFPLCLNSLLWRHQAFLLNERKKCIRQKQLNNTTSWNQLKMNWKWIFCLLILNLNHFNESRLMFRMAIRELMEFLIFFLQHHKVNLETSVYIYFYKSTALAKIKTAAFNTILSKYAFYGGQICSYNWVKLLERAYYMIYGEGFTCKMAFSSYLTKFHALTVSKT